MDQTATKQPSAAPQPQPGAVETNGSVNGAATPPTPKTAPAKQQNIFVRGLHMLADLRITVALFALAMIIVFWGTLAQTDFGVWTVVARYFRSALVWVPLRVVLFNQISDNGMYLPFPGGWLIGGVMLVNLLAAHAIRFKLSWNRGGILLIHAGLIIMMLSEVITGLYAVEGQVIIQNGMTVNQITHPGTAEFAVIENVNAKTDQVTIVPRHRLQPGATIDDPNLLPFKMQIIEYLPNSDVRGIKNAGEIDKDAKGHARLYVAFKVDEVAGVAQEQRHDAPSMYAYLTDHDGKELGKWLFSALLENQYITLKDKDGTDKTYNINLRFKQTKRDFSIHLTKFEHKKFAGTETPKDFHSYILLSDESAGITDRPAEIYMNAPFTYKGETFYQQSWTTDPMTGKANGTILQVVRNPGWAMPYISCLVVGIGMLYHFGITLYKFVDRRIVR